MAPNKVVAFKEEEPEGTKPVQKKATDKLEAAFHELGAAVPARLPAAPAVGVMPAFIRRREHIVGRCAMLGMVACWLGEMNTGMGPMGQLASELHVSLAWAFWATSLLALGHTLVGIGPGSRTFSEDNQRDIARRSRGLTGISAIEPDTSRRVQGLPQVALRTELTLGRLAMLLFAGAMLVDWASNGASPLAMLGAISPGEPLAMAPWWLKGLMGAFALGAVGVLSANDSYRDEETY
ncbi:hypothetical protein N2152v2_010456 [Parachlorella kessleri]